MATKTDTQPTLTVTFEVTGEFYRRVTPMPGYTISQIAQLIEDRPGNCDLGFIDDYVTMDGVISVDQVRVATFTMDEPSIEAEPVTYRDDDNKDVTPEGHGNWRGSELEAE